MAVSLQNKRIVAFVNHFIVTNVQFLNSFFKICEEKLLKFESKLSKLEASVLILEAKLSSIPNIGDYENIVKLSEDSVTNTQETGEQKLEIIDEKIPTEYEKFVKMLQVGVPLEAIKLKINLEGLNVNIFEKFI